jgi:hypothetical protein
MKNLIFVSLLILVLTIVIFTTKVEGFASPPPPRESITAGDFKAFSPLSATLLTPIPGAIAAVNTLPYQDPANEKAPYARLKNTLETAQGFLRIEAPKMGEMSDPEIQLPLTTLRSDVRRLSDEISVLQRNPGIQSSVSQKDLDDIDANLAYLQKKWRNSVNSLSGVEGFTSGARATLPELQDLLVKIGAELVRLGASGTTDPTIQNRLKTLTAIQKSVEDIVTKVTTKQMEESDIPIMEDDYKSFLPLLSNPTSSLPTLLQQNNLPPSLANLFPAYSTGDISGANLMQYLVKTYADTFVKGLSWDLRMNYTSERAQALMDSKKQFAMAAAVTALTPTTATTGTTAGAVANALGSASVDSTTLQPASVDETSSAYRGEFAAATSRGPSHFDWKQRSTEICEAIRKRGYEPGDFGCLDSEAKVGADFSYRGYAKMICNRLRTIYDTSAPEACGCPALGWEGWRL